MMEISNFKVVKVVFSEEENHKTSEMWLYLMTQRIVLDQLNLNAKLKAALLRRNQTNIEKLFKEEMESGL